MENPWENIEKRDLPSQESFSRRELLLALQKKYPVYFPNTFSWIVSLLLKRSLLFRSGYDRYSTKPLLAYSGGLDTPLVEKARSLLLKNKNVGRVVVFAISSLNAWLNELIAHESLLVEVDRRNMDYVFELLRKAFPRTTVLYQPSSAERSRYRADGMIVVVPLFNRSPLPLGNGKMSLEKLAVDLFADRGLRQFFSLDETSEMVARMLSEYSYDERALLNYAKRRNVEASLQTAILSSGIPALKRKGKPRAVKTKLHQRTH